ncbi:MAG: hypothetical protein ACR2QC_03390 [Gammaproteobacteria bacterium]
MAVPVSLASGTLTGDEFYIDSANDHETRTTPATTNLGYERPTCDSGMVLRTDELGCRPLQDSDCLAMTGVGGQEVNNNGVCGCPAGEMENNAGDMCVLDDASCSAMVTGQVSNDGVCECLAGETENIAGTMCMERLTNADCETTTPGSEANTNGNACVFTINSCSGIGGVINAGNDGCDFTDDSCSTAVPGRGANAAGDGCDFTAESCEMFRAGSAPGGVGCECPVDLVVIESETGNETYCVDFAAPANDLYTSDNCIGAEWAIAYELDSSTPAEVVAELCEIPYQVGDPPASLGGDLAPLQVPSGDGENCVMRTNGGGGAAAPLCSDDGLFGGDGFPDKPDGFDDNPNNRLMIVSGVISFNGNPVDRFMPSESVGEQPVRPGTGGIAERDDGAETAAYIGAGMLAVGLASYFLWDGNLLAFSFSPDYGYSITESGYAYNVGGRLDFHQGDFHSYYAVGQANSDGDFGDFRYESGGKYAADFWTAAFSETVQGETADYRFSLSADYSGGIWRLSPTYRLHSHFDEDETETANSLNLEGVLRYNRWTISPSAGFNWRRPEEFGGNARFNLSAVRRF